MRCEECTKGKGRRDGSLDNLAKVSPTRTKLLLGANETLAHPK